MHVQVPRMAQRNEICPHLIYKSWTVEAESWQNICCTFCSGSVMGKQSDGSVYSSRQMLRCDPPEGWRMEPRVLDGAARGLSWGRETASPGGSLFVVSGAFSPVVPSCSHHLIFWPDEFRRNVGVCIPFTFSVSDLILRTV